MAKPFVPNQTTCFLLLCLLCICAQGGNDCSFSPIYVPIRDVTLSTGNAIRGANMSVGTPPQYYAFQPLVQSNNTWLYNETGFCDKSLSVKACTTRRGGQYVLTDSTTSSPTSNLSAIGADLFDNGTLGIHYAKASWVTDDLHFTDDAILKEFPLGISGEDITSATQVSLGLGSNSTILNGLKAAGIIGSRVFSYWWGLAGVTKDAEMDGALILGGYDLAKINDPNQNYTGIIDASSMSICPSGMIVTITDIIMHFPNGSAPNLLDPNLGSSVLQACLCPECAIGMTIALDPYYERFEAWSDTASTGRSVGINFFSMLYPPDKVFTGDLEFKISPGFSVTVPNSQLVLPDLVIDIDSGKVEENTSVSDVVLYALQDVNKNDIPRLGRYFFTSSVLMVNHDTNSFTIWPADPTTDTNIVSVTDKETAQSCSPGATTIGPTGPASAKPASGSGNKLADSHKSAGALAGIVIGSILAVAVVSSGIFYFLYRRRQSKQGPQQPNQDISNVSHFHTESVVPNSAVNAQEMSSETKPPGVFAGPTSPQELHGWAIGQQSSGYMSREAYELG